VPTVRVEDALDRLAVRDPYAAPDPEPRTLPSPADFALALKLRKPWMTYSLVAVTAAIFLLQLAWGEGRPEMVLIRMGGALGTLIRQGQLFRLVSPLFLHLSIVHIAVNMFSLVNLGSLVELVIGRRRLLIVYVGAGIAGNLLVALARPQQAEGGASTGLWGLMAFIAVLVMRPRGLMPDEVAARLRPRMYRAVGVNVLISLVPGISLLGHLGGAIGGLAFGMATPFLKHAPAWTDAGAQVTPQPVWVRAGAVLAGLVAVLSLATGVAVGRPWGLAHPVLVPVQVGDTGLTLSVPDESVTREAHSASEESYTLGSIALDPAAVVLTVFRQKEPIGDAPAALELLRAEAQKANKALQAGKQAFTPPQVDQTKRPALHYELTLGMGTMYIYIFVLKTSVIRLEVVVRSDAPDEWKALPRPIYDSLKVPASGEPG
jgi:rhomboid protease GluP